MGVRQMIQGTGKLVLKPDLIDTPRRGPCFGRLVGFVGIVSDYITLLSHACVGNYVGCDPKEISARIARAGPAVRT
jgi:hypothetical protein